METNKKVMDGKKLAQIIDRGFASQCLPQFAPRHIFGYYPIAKHSAFES